MAIPKQLTMNISTTKLTFPLPTPHSNYSPSRFLCFVSGDIINSNVLSPKYGNSWVLETDIYDYENIFSIYLLYGYEWAGYINLAEPHFPQLYHWDNPYFTRLFCNKGTLLGRKCTRPGRRGQKREAIRDNTTFFICLFCQELAQSLKIREECLFLHHPGPLIWIFLTLLPRYGSPNARRWLKQSLLAFCLCGNTFHVPYGLLFV